MMWPSACLHALDIAVGLFDPEDRAPSLDQCYWRLLPHVELERRPLSTRPHRDIVVELVPRSVGRRPPIGPPPPARRVRKVKGVCCGCNRLLPASCSYRRFSTQSNARSQGREHAAVTAWEGSGWAVVRGSGRQAYLRRCNSGICSDGAGTLRALLLSCAATKACRSFL